MSNEQKKSSGQDWATTESYTTPMEICWNFDYAISVDKLENLYSKAKRLQWDAETEMDWDYEVDPSKPMVNADSHIYFQMPFFKKLSKSQQESFSAHQTCHLLSQFLHGEQGALMTAAAVTHAVPDYDAKLYSATQTMDEARHVEVYEKYINKVAMAYPIMPMLKDTIDITLSSGSFVKVMIGMNMVIEGLALAAFHNMRHQTTCPLLKRITEYVLRDEARHVAFGNIYLSKVIKDMHPDDREDIADFAFQVVERMHQRTGGNDGKRERPQDPGFLMMLENVGIDPVDFIAGVREAAEAGVRPVNPPGTLNSFKDLMMPALVRVGAVTDRARTELYAPAEIPIWEDTHVLESMENMDTGEFEFEHDRLFREKDEHDAREDAKRAAQVAAE